MLHDPTKEVAALFGQPQFSGLAAVVGFHGKNIGLGIASRCIPDRDMGVTPIAGQALDGLGHERRAVAVLFSNAFGHEFEEGVLVRRVQRIVEIPVHLPLAIRVFVVVLIGVPPEFQHVVGNLTDHV